MPVLSPPSDTTIPNLATPAVVRKPASWSDILKKSLPPTGPNQAATNGLTPLSSLLTTWDPATLAKSPIIQPRGLVNQGNMCFMNAVLQVLVYCPPFYNLFASIGKRVVQQIGSTTPLMDAMVMFIQEFELLSGQMALEDIGEAFSPDNVYQSMRGNSRFNSMQRGHQEDAEEFLGFLLDGLHEEFVTAMKPPGQMNGHSRQSSQQDNASVTDEWLEVGKKQKLAVTRTSTITESPISSIFGGHMRSILKITGAKDSVTLEPFQPLQLDIQSEDVSTIEDALRKLPEPEILSDSWTDASGQQVSATKQVFIETLPPVLILHLKRFLYDNVGGTQKFWKQVGYPLELEMPSQALSPARRGIVRTTYKLIGVVYHHGLSASGGHYTVDVLRQDGKSWIHLDDTSISPVEAKDVAVEVDRSRHTLGRPSKLAYILLYGRV
ncbi:hypothetical protein BCR37DRAFT_350248 [Protomyces lactucae-debilis]|uniref:Ubiquitin carboxyl-terminal hydrolase n=1 Tax=Protomyces lactucae-debilis TaxID=2754530 RepID=A0A1Y2F530_PROLT|nr:uncharacterized protein BCR37DRAFT_350248 [Protomyces lactucae-debilis]ORY78594.1 hypothetical protein BCR37DRAFT_350248 [Protomyces lactucae-debilis]